MVKRPKSAHRFAGSQRGSLRTWKTVSRCRPQQVLEMCQRSCWRSTARQLTPTVSAPDRQRSVSPTSSATQLLGRSQMPLPTCETGLWRAQMGSLTSSRRHRSTWASPSMSTRATERDRSLCPCFVMPTPCRLRASWPPTKRSSGKFATTNSPSTTFRAQTSP